MVKKKRKTLPKNFGDLVEAGNVDALKSVFDTCELSAYDDRYSLRTALHHYEIPDEFVRWIVLQGLDINTKDYYGKTPIFYQAMRGNVALFIELGAGVNARANYGDTPLHFAADLLNVDSVRTLIERGADIHAENDSGLTPLAYTLARNEAGYVARLEPVVQVLLGEGAKTTPDMAERVAQIGKDFEFHRENFDEQDDAAMARLYGMFGVAPAAKRRVYDGVSPIEATSEGWQNQHQELWELLVPSSGAAATVQGEAIRITGRVSDELYRNGGANWDANYRKMLDALLGQLASGTALSPEELKQAKESASAIGPRGNFDDAAIDCLCELAVEWVLQNPHPVPLEKPEYNR